MAFALIAAAGTGDRLGGRACKFETDLAGRPLVMYSLDAFQEAACIEGIVLVVPEGREGSWHAGSLSGRGVTKALATVPGGATRQASVLEGLKALGDRQGVVVIHDAARPLVTPALIESVCAIPEGFSGMIAAAPVTDTVKEVADGAVSSTLARGRLVAAQTPQAFDLRELIEAHEDAARDGFEGTDDASLVERRGGRVGVVPGGRDNIKITYPEDLVMAEAMLAGRRP